MYSTHIKTYNMMIINYHGSLPNKHKRRRFFFSASFQQNDDSPGIYKKQW